MTLPALRIRTKTFLLMASLLTGIACATALMLIKIQSDALYEELDRTRIAIRQQLTARAQLLASAERSFVERVLPENQHELIGNELSALSQGQQDVRYGILMDTSRRALFHPNPKLNLRRLDDERARWAAKQTTLAEREFPGGTEPILEVAIPILEDKTDPDTGADYQVRRATLRFGLSMAGLQRAIREADERARANVRRSWRLAGALTAGALLVGLVFAFFIGGRLVRPIERLTREAEAIARGRLDQPIAAASRDEIGRLASSFDEMRRGVQGLLVRTAEKARMETELNTARAVQKSLLPPAAPTYEHFDVAAFYEPATEMGGDWYAYLRGRGDSLYIVVGDVTGHGAASALVAAAARSVCSTLASGVATDLIGGELSPSTILSMLNREIATIGGDLHMMTAAVVRLDLGTGALVHSTAAHNKPLILRADGAIDVLPGTGPVLGEDLSCQYVDREAQILPGDLLLMYTDGLIENTDDRNREWGRRRLASALRKAAENDNARRAVESLRNAALRFYNQVPVADDVTFVIVRAKSGTKRATMDAR